MQEMENSLILSWFPTAEVVMAYALRHAFSELSNAQEEPECPFDFWIGEFRKTQTGSTEKFAACPKVFRTRLISKDFELEFHSTSLQANAVHRSAR